MIIIIKSKYYCYYDNYYKFRLFFSSVFLSFIFILVYI